MLFKVENLSKTYFMGKKKLQALTNISFEISKGKTLGLVGESGSGKSTVALTLTRLEEPSSGKLLKEGKNLFDLSSSAFKKYRKEIQLVLQDPYASLNPRKIALDTVAEAFLIHNIAPLPEAKQRAAELLLKLGITQEHLVKFPHELSGGQRQRISIARALAVSPLLLILDEPLSSLDVSVQAQIIELLEELQKEEELSYLFISHDLPMVRYFCHEVAVLYQGMIIEKASSDELFENPLHPYTKHLMASIPSPDPLIEKERKKLPFYFDPIDFGKVSSGCPYFSACSYAKKACSQGSLTLKEVLPNHFVACHFASEINLL